MDFEVPDLVFPANVCHEYVVNITTAHPAQIGAWIVFFSESDGNSFFVLFDQTFFVLPESSIGAIGLIASSIGALGAFMIWKRKTAHSQPVD